MKRSVSAKFSDGEIKGVVRLLSSLEDIVPDNADTLAALHQKHPPSPDDPSMPPPAEYSFPAPTLASVDDIWKALASFGPGSAGGPDGLRPSHLLALTSRKAAEAGERSLSSLTGFVNLVLKREIPDFARIIFYGASLCALAKKDEGPS